MKIKTLVDLVKAGRKPVVKFTGYVMDEIFGEDGMLAEVTGISKDEHCYKATFEYGNFRTHNTALMARDWFLSDSMAEKLGRTQGTAIESGNINDDLVEDIYLELEGDINLELVEDNPVLNEYMKSGSQDTYVVWLEKFIQANVPECMKPWSQL